jgi:hypothetical protein
MDPFIPPKIMLKADKWLSKAGPGDIGKDGRLKHTAPSVFLRKQYIKIPTYHMGILQSRI